MTITLNRTLRCEDGVFGELLSGDTHIAFTLEHAYVSSSGWAPKIPDGTYRCVRGTHRLVDSRSPFITFEIQVPGFTGLLFHIGNFNNDSSGCVLVAQEMLVMDNGQRVLYKSRIGFDMFMTKLAGVNAFELTVASVFTDGNKALT